MDTIQPNTLTSKKEAKPNCLQLTRVEAKYMFNLCYVNTPFFNLDLKIKSVFHTLFSENGIAAYEIRIVAGVIIALGMAHFGFNKFFSQSHNNCDKVKVICQIYIFYMAKLREEIVFER